jgi:hypothetical protein
MRATVIVTDDDGNSWEYEFHLSPRKEKTGTIAKSRGKEPVFAPPAMGSKGEASRPEHLDITLPVRAFMKRYGRGIPGARKFVLLVARMANGNLEARVPRSDIEKQWNKMKELMGGPFNSAHASRARDDGWVDVPEHGLYKLRAAWKGVVANG